MSGDSIRVVRPLYPEEGDGAIPISPLQLTFGIISNALAARLNATRHSRLPLITNGWDCDVSFAAEYQGRYYASAMWGHPRSQSFDQRYVLELRRMAIAPDAPKNTASRMLGWMRRWIKDRYPTITRLISYQDTEVHTGTIYAASGWTPKGTTKFSPWKNNRLKIERTQSTADKIRWEYQL